MREKLIILFIFGVTAFATAWQQFKILMWAVWGAPASVIQYVGLFGSLVLALASAVALIHRRTAYYMGLLAAGLIWAFYGPALWFTIPLTLSEPGRLGIEPWTLVPAFLLIVLTVFLVVARGQAKRGV